MTTDRDHSEASRLVALNETGILDGGVAQNYDAFARIAARMFAGPVALVTFVDADTQWFKAKIGTDLPGRPRDVAFCNYVIDTGEVLEVEDLTADPRFANNNVVTGPPHVRYYIGAPVILSTGERLGTVCVLDVEPRKATPEQIETLKDLAMLTGRDLDARRAERTARWEADSMRDQRDSATEQAAASELVARELSHRMGNMFAQVSGLVSLADRQNDTRQDLVAAVKRHMVALKNVNDLLVNRKWVGARMTDIVDAVLAPMREAGDRALLVDSAGPSLDLNDRASFHLALVLSELGANAVRHGALSRDGGEVEVKWSITEEVFELVWQEHGVDDLSPPTRQGFGSTLLTKVAPAGLAGDAKLSFDPPGFRYRLTADLGHVAAHMTSMATAAHAAANL